MLSNVTYLDHNAASPMLAVIKDKILALPAIALNPSSVHKYGRIAKSYIENARAQILESVNANDSDANYNLVFTSSGTESNNMVIKAFADYNIICSKIEHLSILLPVQDCNSYRLIDVDSNGLVDLTMLEKELQKSSKPSLVSISVANNETGIIQDLKAISNLTKKYGAILHSDAIQAYGKIKFDIKELDVDIVTIACHKVGGPKGVSALISKKSINMQCLMKGGGQERGKRAGTENVEAIYGFGELAAVIDDVVAKNMHLSVIRDYIENGILAYCPGAFIFSNDACSKLPNTSSIYMPDHSSQLQQIAFDLSDIAISAGSACSSGKIANSHVLEAMGFAQEMVSCAVRVSLGHNNNLEDAKKFIKTWKEIFTKTIKDGVTR